MRFTVFGAGGFIGSRLAAHLRAQGHEVLAPTRSADEVAGADLGHVVYAIGLTADFRARPFDTVEAHVTTLARLLRDARYESWLYLSSTRLYGTAARAACREDDPICVAPGPDSLYDISKLQGEALCLTLARTRVARLANVYGAGQSPASFLGAILEELRAGRDVTIREAPASCKDYVAVAAILPLLEAIAARGCARIYNVASGRRLAHAELAERLARATGRRVAFEPGAPERAFPPIDVTRVATEFAFSAPSLADDLDNLLTDSGIPLRGSAATRP